jgi:hypothetical protein
MVNKVIFSSFLYVLFLGFTVGGGQETKASPVKLTGTFSSLQFNDESGDLLGAEIKIVPIKDENYQGVIQIAEGEPSDLLVVNVIYSGESIEFIVPKPYEGKFTGKISTKGIVGKLVYPNGGEMPLNMPRKKSYWD